MAIKTLAVLALTLFLGAVGLAVHANAYNCTTTCSGYGNMRTCNTTCF